MKSLQAKGEMMMTVLDSLREKREEMDKLIAELEAVAWHYSQGIDPAKVSQKSRVGDVVSYEMTDGEVVSVPWRKVRF